MKIAIVFKNSEIKKEIETELEKRNFETSDSSDSETLWVYGLKNITTVFADGYEAHIQIEQQGSMQYYVLLEQDIIYFEIHGE